ncbi:MAG: hypothetical protein M1825_004176 [Sarcosagium campestre]|nr:MAG: hypothetical protein M1825_004176 [Sarcosagium campestre]
MADLKKSSDGPSPFADEGFDESLLPDFNTEFIDESDVAEFAKALSPPDSSSDDLSSSQQSSVFITALNDWRPIRQRVRRKTPITRKRRPPRRGKDETREGFVYTLLKWPLLVLALAWIVILGFWYILTRLYIWLYEHYVSWRGPRQQLRAKLQSAASYADWVKAAKELDRYLGNEEWKRTDEYAYYDHETIKRVSMQIRKMRLQVESAKGADKGGGGGNGANREKALDELKALLEGSVKNNFAGFENSRLYSQTYYGTKTVVQDFIDEVEKSLILLLNTPHISQSDKRDLFKHLHTNLGRTALCLSGGATMSYYHFGVAKALLDANLMPEVITGTSGGALVAALLATRTDAELKKLLVPALAGRITACHDDVSTWVRRWYLTGARFDSLDWARRCSWFTRGSMTFREAYERTGRILNISCIPSDPHSPTILANYLTAPDCVIWSAVLASAAVPGILNPVVLMRKTRDGSIAPYAFGHKWKDGSLRTDIPLKALNLHFNVHFSIVSQVNPHINLFFFSSRGTVGRPVTHRRGRGWRGGFLGSATEQYIKLDLNKWLRVLRHLELLPRPLGQDWSEIWLQRFSGTITIWPKSIASDFYYILSDPNPQRLARMLHVGQQSAFPKLKFIANRMKIERLVEAGRRATRPAQTKSGISSILSEDDLQKLLREARKSDGAVPVAPPPLSLTPSSATAPATPRPTESPGLGLRFGHWFSGLSSPTSTPDPAFASGVSGARELDTESLHSSSSRRRRPGSMMSEFKRQGSVFFDDTEVEDTEAEIDGEGSAGGSTVDGDIHADAVWSGDDDVDAIDANDDDVYDDARHESMPHLNGLHVDGGP